eukprot:TRINITY_DN24727_c0_g1_i1.p1 TRINITY_DN24727_c0_g1~~TRINITY_DN24727_c0_g1_i1.p1  ORF type:complete len:118 (-),score=43.93 TRINITY_DN24727_c0_g1_i1:64-417(-)
MCIRDSPNPHPTGGKRLTGQCTPLCARRANPSPDPNMPQSDLGFEDAPIQMAIEEVGPVEDEDLRVEMTVNWILNPANQQAIDEREVAMKAAEIPEPSTDPEAVSYTHLTLPTHYSV